MKRHNKFIYLFTLILPNFLIFLTLSTSSNAQSNNEYYLDNSFTEYIKQNNGSNVNNSNTQMNPTAQCVNQLLYQRVPVCTKFHWLTDRPNCNKSGLPESHADAGTGGWQWQTIRTDVTAQQAIGACTQ